jgi:DNA segregation ATPase FtsK/SpoIIIE, S-DNA-T family
MRRSVRVERKGVLSRQQIARQRALAKRDGFGRDLGGVFGFAAAVALTIALASFDVRHPAENLIGPVGHWFATRLLGTFGICAYLVPVALLYVAVTLFVRAAGHKRGRQMLGLIGLATFGAALAHLSLSGSGLTAYPSGGHLGATLGEALRRSLSTVGSIIVTASAVTCALIVLTNAALVRLFAWLGRQMSAAARQIQEVFRGWAQSAWLSFVIWRKDRAREAAEEKAEVEKMLAEAEDSEVDDRTEDGELDAEEAEAVAEEAERLAREAQGLKRADEIEERRASSWSLGRIPEEDPAWATSEEVDLPREARRADGQAQPKIQRPLPRPKVDPAPVRRAAPNKPEAVLNAKREPEIEIDVLPEDAEEIGLEPEVVPAPAAEAAPQSEEPSPEEPPASPPPPPPEALAESKKPTIVEPKSLPKVSREEKAHDPYAFAEGQTFSLPPLTLLEDTHSSRPPIDEQAFLTTAQKLTAKLADFGIDGSVVEIRPGPVVTMYEFAPGPGIKISKIASLADDLAMAMEALRVRIVAPIPGKGVVGIEVPNRERETVYFREIVEQDAFQKSTSKLNMALGKDIEGMPYIADLAKMPHLLIAGTTGSGKSVAVNSMVMSLLLKATPEDVRFLMVDPKRLELSLYEGIPHLLLPVVTDPRKAALALRWAVEEMERRYQLLADVGVRNIAQYNKVVGRGRSGPIVITPKRPKNLLVVDVAEGESEEEALARAAGSTPEEAPPAEDAQPPRQLPYVVIVIDELADLMMVASREVEMYIARLAQMARAAGIHLVVATQRPSTDVVTGVIKANFPARISFQLRSKPDSMTILGTPGAEALLGRGDMLILPPTSSHLTRIHGAYVSESEIHQVVDYLRAQAKPVYDENILRPREDESDLPEEEEFTDELYEQAMRLVSEMRQVSISMLQRRMRIGYQRSARMIERMEREGLVGPADGAKPREVLMRPPDEGMEPRP